MSTENKEFYDLLNSIVNEKTFNLDLSPKETQPVGTALCKPLSTIQLKRLIETIVDSPVTQSLFNSTVNKIFKECLVQPVSNLNVFDRLLFILETRIQSLSPTMTAQEDGVALEVNFRAISNKLKQLSRQNPELFLDSSATEGQLSITFGIPLLDTDTQLSEEIYKNVNPDIENTDELRKILGESFVNEIAKYIKTVSVGEKALTLSTLTFKNRLKMVETLPASIIQKVIDYIEKYKKATEECLTVEGTVITIDGSLFSLR
jgi:hypothetical protein